MSERRRGGGPPVGAVRVMRRALRRQRGRVTAGVSLLCLHQAAEALVPVVIGLVIDRAVADGDVDALIVSLAALAVLFTVLAYAWRFGAQFAYAAVEREAHTTRVEIATKALDPRGQRSGMRDGELLSVTASDAELAALAVRAAGLAAAAATALIVAAVALLAIDVPLGLLVLLGVPAIVTALQRLAPLLTRRSADQQAALAGATALAADLVGGVRVLRGLGAQHNAAERYADASRRALAATLRSANTKGVHRGVTTAVNGMFLALVAGVAGWSALRGDLTVGEFVAVVGLAQFVAEPVQTFGFSLQLYAVARASAGRVAQVLGAPPVIEPGDTPAAPAAAPRLLLDEVSYRSLDRVGLHLGPAELLGVLTYDPRDAAALLDLLARRVPRSDYQGLVAIDAVPMEHLDVDASRRSLLVDQHDVVLFEGTVRSNLTTAVASANADDVLVAAVRAAAAEDLLAGHPDGLDRPIGERGANLSGGQRQRIGLARAVAADPPILVLHDPTTSVDPVTEHLVADRMVAARDGRCTIVVTTSPALLARTDRVVVIDAGRTVAEGTHAELLRSDPRYRKAVLR